MTTISDPTGPQEEPGAAFPSDSPITCSQVQELSIPYVLSSAEEDEIAIVDSHLPTCPICSKLIADLNRSVSLLAFTSPRVSPPPTAKAALFTRIAHASVLDPITVSADQISQYRSITLPPSSVPVTITAVAPPARRSWADRALQYAALPLALAIFAIGYWGLNTRSDLSDRSAQVNALNSQVSTLSQQVDTYSNSLSSLGQALRSNNSDEYQMVPLSYSGDSAGNAAAGKIVAASGGDSAYLMAWNLDPTVVTYDIILQNYDGTEVQAGSMTCDGSGNGSYDLVLTRPITDYQRVILRPSGESSPSLDNGDSPGQAQTLVARLGASFGQQGDTTTQSP